MSRHPKPLPHLLDTTFTDLAEASEQFGGQKFRVVQVCDWAIERRAETFEAMTSLPHNVREDLSKKFALRKLKLIQRQDSKLDPTVKFTFNAGDKDHFSAVFLPHKGYNTLCISTQVGCAWKCAFCASGLVPFQRNLTSGEILDQIFWAEKETKQKISNILFMGMGEPLGNYDGTVRTVKWLTSRHGFGMSASRITLSTTGVAPMIERIAKEKLKINLALSLHAPTDELRKKIMPVSARFPIENVLAACKRFQTMNGSDFTIEYILLKGVNDSDRHAEDLAKLLQEARFSPLPKINLIPYNPVEGLPFGAPAEERVRKFFFMLRRKRFMAHTRKPQGQDIHGACGQLL